MARLKSPRLQAESSNLDCWKWAAIAALALQMTAGGAEPIVQWTTVAGGPGRDYPSGIALTPAGGLYLVGNFEQEVIGRWNRPTKVLYKFDLSGTMIGSQASRGEAISAVAVDAQGNYYLTGYAWEGDRIDANAFHLAKYSSTGTLLWERNAGKPTSSTAHSSGGSSIALDVAGHVYVAGASSGPEIFGSTTFPATAGGPLLCKYDQDGTLLWAKRAETGGGGGTIALDTNGDIVMTGFASNGQADFGGIVITINGPYGSYSYVAKYSATGFVKWAKAAHGGSGVAVDRRGNVYCTGDAISADPAGLNGLHCSKFTREGDLIWERTIQGATPSGLALNGNEEPIFTGEMFKTVQLDQLTVQHNGPENEILVCKADAAGTFQWALVGRGSARVTADQIVCDRAGNAYVAGTIGCSVINGSWVCYEGILGSSPLNTLFPSDSYDARDVFVTRLTDPEAVAVELSIARAVSGLALSWPVQATNFVLESATTLPAVSWTTVTNTPTVTATDRSVQLPLTGSAKFFRLRNQ